MEDRIYEQLLTEALEQRLAPSVHTPPTARRPTRPSPALLTRRVAEVLERELPVTA